MFTGVAYRLTVALLLILPFVQSAISQEPKLQQLLLRSPQPVNAICYLHTPSLKKLLADAKISIELADNVEEVWLVSNLDADRLQPVWEAGYATMKQMPKVEDLAKQLGGFVDVIGTQKAIRTPKQSYIVPYGQDRVGFLRPAKRKLLTDWLGGTAGHVAPAYLAAQSKQPEQFLSLMVAIDLQDSFSPVDLVSRLGTFDSLKGQDSQLVADLLSTVQGVGIIVGRQSLSECILTIEFAKSPAPLASIGNAVLDEILKRNGTGAPEVASWKTKVNGNKLSFQGAISAESLDSILGIFSIRGYAEQIADSAAANSLPKQSSGSVVPVATKEYFDKVKVFIERVRKYEAQSSGYRAKWDEQQARRIDEIGTLNVDPQMIEYGANVSNILRGNSIAIRTGNVAAGQIQAAQSALGGIGYDGEYYGGYYGTRDRAITGAQQRMGAGGSYRQAISMIDQLTGEVRRAMTEKFSIQF